METGLLFISEPTVNLTCVALSQYSFLIDGFFSENQMLTGRWQRGKDWCLAFL